MAISSPGGLCLFTALIFVSVLGVTGCSGVAVRSIKADPNEVPRGFVYSLNQSVIRVTKSGDDTAPTYGVEPVTVADPGATFVAQVPDDFFNFFSNSQFAAGVTAQPAKLKSSDASQPLTTFAFTTKDDVLGASDSKGNSGSVTGDAATGSKTIQDSLVAIAQITRPSGTHASSTAGSKQSLLATKETDNRRTTTGGDDKSPPPPTPLIAEQGCNDVQALTGSCTFRDGTKTLTLKACKIKPDSADIQSGADKGEPCAQFPSSTSEATDAYDPAFNCFDDSKPHSWLLFWKKQPKSDKNVAGVRASVCYRRPLPVKFVITEQDSGKETIVFKSVVDRRKNYGVVLSKKFLVGVSSEVTLDETGNATGYYEDSPSTTGQLIRIPMAFLSDIAAVAVGVVALVFSH